VAEAAYCGVDIGTTHLKAVLVTVTGHVLSIARRGTPVTDDGVGPCHDADTIRTVAEELMVQAQRSAPVKTRIHGVGVTSVGEEGVPLDRSGEVLYPAIAWYDRRESPASRAWWGEHSEEDLRAVSGLHRDLGFTLFKWLWLRSHQRDVWTRCALWLGIGDYLVWRWCGRASMSVSHASRTCVFDLQNFGWHEEWASQALFRGIDALPRPVNAGTVVGHLMPGTIPDLEVSSGAPVVATGLDHSVGSYAAGIRSDGQLMDSMGTAAALVAPLGHIDHGPWPPPGRADFGAGLTPLSHIALAGLGSGAGLNRLRESIGARSAGQIAALEQAAANVPPGADRLIYVPSRIRDSGQGAFLGMRSGHTAAHRYRAALEGWSMAMAEAVDALPAAVVPHTDVACTGGGAQSRLWLKIKASILDRPIRHIMTAEMVGIGAARLAAEADGAVRPDDLWIPEDERTVDPEARWVDGYRQQRDSFSAAARKVFASECPPFYP
jgi:xylulokinase